MGTGIPCINVLFNSLSLSFSLPAQIVYVLEQGLFFLVCRNRDYSLYKNILFFGVNVHPKQSQITISILGLLAQMSAPWNAPDLNDEALGHLFRIICLAFRAISISQFERASLSDEGGGTWHKLN